MAVVVWKDKVKIVVGELTRRAELQMANEVERIVAALPDDATPEQFAASLDELVAVLATRSIQVCIDGVWLPVDAGHARTVDLGEGDTFTLNFPPVAAEMASLPGSLYEQWLNAAANENTRVQDRFLAAITGLASTTSTSAPPSGDAPSS